MTRLLADPGLGAITITTCTGDVLRLRGFADLADAREELARLHRLALTRKNVGELRVAGLIPMDGEFRFFPHWAHIVQLVWRSVNEVDKAAMQFRCEHLGPPVEQP